MGVSYSRGVSQEEYGTGDDDEILKDDRCYWSLFVILFLQNDGSAPKRGVRSMYAFTAFLANGVDELPPRCGGWLQALLQTFEDRKESPSEVQPT